jgi:hypothetical protein
MQGFCPITPLLVLVFAAATRRRHHHSICSSDAICEHPRNYVLTTREPIPLRLTLCQNVVRRANRCATSSLLSRLHFIPNFLNALVKQGPVLSLLNKNASTNIHHFSGIVRDVTSTGRGSADVTTASAHIGKSRGKSKWRRSTSGFETRLRHQLPIGVLPEVGLAHHV